MDEAAFGIGPEEEVLTWQKNWERHNPEPRDSKLHIAWLDCRWASFKRIFLAVQN